MGVLGTMTVNFTANVSGLQSGVNQAQGTVNSFASAAGTALLATGVAAVGAGIAATKMAGDFQAGMTSLVTGAGESQKNIGLVSSGILDLATKTGTSTKQLTDGMYMIESAGYHGKTGLDVLKNAAEGAKVGNADLKTVANAVTTEMTDYASKNLTAAQATNTLVATVANGKTTMQELGASLANILPTASAAGVSLTDTSAAMSTMTGEGIPAAQAATYLRQTIMAVENPAKKASDTMKAMGLSSSDVAAEMKKSLPDALAMITDAAAKKFPVGSQGYISAIANMVGGTKSMQGILDLTGDHLDTFKGNVTNIAGAVKNGGDSINGWSNVQQTFNFKLAQAGEVLETTGIKIGTLLLPAVGRLLGVLSSPGFQSFATTVGNLLVAAVNGLASAMNVLIPIVSNVASFFQHNQAAMVALQGVLVAVAGVIGGILVQAFVAWTIATWAQVVAAWALVAPYVIAGAIIALVIFGIVEAVQHWGAISTWLQGVWQGFTSWWNGFLSGALSAWNTAINGLKSAGASFLSWFNTWKPQIESVALAITVFFLPALIKAGVEATIAGVKIAVGFIKSVIQSGIEAAVSGAKLTVSFVQSMIQSGIEAAAAGVKITIGFVQSMIQTGIQAVVNAAKVTGSFVMSLIQAGMEGWAAAGKIGTFILSMISTGAQALLAGAKVVGSFILSMITTGTQAVISGAQVVGSFIVSLVSAGIEAITSGAIIMASVVPALIATAVAALATAAPFILIGIVIAAVVIGIVLAIQHWSQIVTWFQGVWTVTWNAVSSFFTGLWNGIISFLGAAWNVIVNIAKVAGALLLAVIIGPIGLLVIFIIQHWAQISAATSSFINGVVNFFAQLPSRIMSFLSGLPGMIMGLWNNIITDATNAGSSIVNGIANGIRAAIGAVGSAISAVTDFISAHLPHSPAKIGALKDLQLQGSLIPEQISTGILSNMSKLDTTMSKLPYPGSSSTTNSSAAVLAALAAGNNNGNNQPIENHIYIDGKEVTSRLGPHIANAIRVQQGKRGR